MYNYQLVITGSNIILLRQKFIQELKSHAIIKHSNIAEFENFDIEYSVKENKIEDIAKHLEDELKAGEMHGSKDLWDYKKN